MWQYSALCASKLIRTVAFLKQARILSWSNGASTAGFGVLGLIWSVLSEQLHCNGKFLTLTSTGLAIRLIRLGVLGQVRAQLRVTL